MNRLTRRTFMGAIAAGGAGAMMLSLPQRVRGANEVVNVGFIGVGGRGSHSVNWFRQVPGVRIAAICDADQAFIDREVKKCEERGEKVKGYIDARKMLESKDIDAVVISTCNHTHALLTIWACQAGKDVYVEKPATHNIYEGAKLIEATEKYDRIVQVGTQNRSDTGCIPAFEYIQSGALGRIKLVRGFCYRNRNSIGKADGTQQIPSTLDYNLWSGPAPMEPLTRQRLHYDWHWVWPTGNGDIGNQGTHETDLACWVLGEKGLPDRIISIGGRFGWDDDGTTPNTQTTLFEFKSAPLIFEVRNLRTSADSDTMDHYKGVRVGVVVECENGYFAGGRGGGWTYDNDDNRLQRFPGDGGRTHARNFIDAVRSRRRQDLTADIVGGVQSAALAHLANISHKCGTPTPVAEIASRAREQDAFSDSFQSIHEQLQRNNIDLAAMPLTLGAQLTWDEATASLRHPDEQVQKLANQLSTREYREPFVVGPEV